MYPLHTLHCTEEFFFSFWVITFDIPTLIYGCCKTLFNEGYHWQYAVLGKRLVTTFWQTISKWLKKNYSNIRKKTFIWNIWQTFAKNLAEMFISLYRLLSNVCQLFFHTVTNSLTNVCQTFSSKWSLWGSLHYIVIHFSFYRK